MKNTFLLQHFKTLEQAEHKLPVTHYEKTLMAFFYHTAPYVL